MKLPKIDKPGKYVGLYVMDFGDSCGVGYTAEEVATLLESEGYREAKVYKIHQARPDGTIELAGVVREKFFVESGMFFHCRSEREGRGALQKLLAWSDKQAVPCRAKLQLAKNEKQLLIALIYPAEYEHEMGNWVLDSGFSGSGAVDAGVSQVDRYYKGEYELLEREQLWADSSLGGRGRDELLAAVGCELQR